MTRLEQALALLKEGTAAAECLLTPVSEDGQLKTPAETLRAWGRLAGWLLNARSFVSWPEPKPTPVTGLTVDERTALARLASSGAPSERDDAGRAADILRAFDDGVLPPPESIEWFISRFRTARSQ